jgi:hypothetical protein
MPYSPVRLFDCHLCVTKRKVELCHWRILLKIKNSRISGDSIAKDEFVSSLSIIIIAE